MTKNVFMATFARGSTINIGSSRICGRMESSLPLIPALSCEGVGARLERGYSNFRYLVNCYQIATIKIITSMKSGN